MVKKVVKIFNKSFFVFFSIFHANFNDNPFNHVPLPHPHPLCCSCIQWNLHKFLKSIENIFHVIHLLSLLTMQMRRKMEVKLRSIIDFTFCHTVHNLHCTEFSHSLMLMLQRVIIKILL